MYRRKTGQISMFDSPEMFGGIPLSSENEWIRLSKIVPWDEFEKRYSKNFSSKKGQPACPSRMALGAILIKERYKFSDVDVVKEIAMNPYLQYFIGLTQFQHDAPFNASMMTRFRKRVCPKMLAWVNDIVIEREKLNKEETPKDIDEDDNDDVNGTGKEDRENHVKSENKEKLCEEDIRNSGTLILDATCVPQNIRFPTDASLLNEARLNSEEIIDVLHENKLTKGKKPRTYRTKAKKTYNSFSKDRKKTSKKTRKAVGKQLGFLKRNLAHIQSILTIHKDALLVLPKWLQERYFVLLALYEQQDMMYTNATHRVEDRIVSFHQPWVRPIVRGKQNRDVEFGAKVELSVVNGYTRVEEIHWEAFNEGKTLKASIESYKKAYGFYPARVLADKIFRTRENRQYCKEHGMHMNGPKLGKPFSDPILRKQQQHLEWLESGERGEIERNIGVGKNRYSLGCIAQKLKETSELTIQASVLAMNLWKKLRLLFAHFFAQAFSRQFCTSFSDFFLFVSLKFAENEMNEKYAT